MLRMMDYKEVNRRLRLPFGDITAVSPNDRCIWKSLAIAKGAVLTSPFNQASWADNRLLPVEAVPYMLLITFDPANGESTTTIRVPSGTTPSYGSTPSKSGYDFAGWSPTIGPATEDKTYTALWTSTAPTTYTITWNPNGGTWQDTTGGTGNRTTTEYAGDTITTISTGLTPPSGGYAFGGWQGLTPGATATGNVTFTAIWNNAPVLDSDVVSGWKIDSDGGGTGSAQHGDGNVYETATWLYNTNGAQIPINMRFEPMYTKNGTEVSYSTAIGHYGNTTFTHDDLTWDAVVGTSTGGYNYDLDILFRTYNNTGQSATDQIITKITYIGTTKTDDGSTHKGYGFAVKSEGTQWDQDFIWMDEIPVTYIAKYNGTEAFRITIKIIAYSLAAINGYPYYGLTASIPANTLIGGSISNWGGSWIVSVHPVSS